MNLFVGFSFELVSETNPCSFTCMTACRTLRTCFNRWLTNWSASNRFLSTKYSHRMPSMASCWMNLMLDSLTSAPEDSTKESPLAFFSITTSSGNPKPGTQNARVNTFNHIFSYISCFAYNLCIGSNFVSRPF